MEYNGIVCTVLILLNCSHCLNQTLCCKNILYFVNVKIVNIGHFSIESESQTLSPSPKGRVRVIVHGDLSRTRVRVTSHTSLSHPHKQETGRLDTIQATFFFPWWLLILYFQETFEAWGDL